ncbi:MAG: GNAT family N-acetyltransferase [Fuerstiella sp.]
MKAQNMLVPDSDRLKYRLLDCSEADSELLWQLDQDPLVMKFITRGKTTTRAEMRDRFLPRLQAYRNPESGWGLWGVHSNPADHFLGWILIRPMGFFDGERDDRNLEIGWRFHQSAWGKGYATEAAHAVAAGLILNDHCDDLSAVALPENTASIQVMKKLGLRYVNTTDHDDDDYGIYQLARYSAAVREVRDAQRCFRTSRENPMS